MAKKNSSPFEHLFRTPPYKQKESEPKDVPAFDWPDLFSEVSKTWKSIAPIVKPMMDKFKK
ncbi:hypothetical protein [Halobacillus sp. BBL2006]|uniref:hypothetical protein n=1 Tax=Halobacillus sp. BBL2006 TaxID=1543706 RepID=UPI00054329D0|nr:hypothetical protein [Halobacillus sp. BBL2006]KHE69460.1 hypothetical protein LD39_12825 [Halobacillus sp. BBL2006]